MTEHRKSYKTFTREFKLEALRLMEQSDKPASEIATELGIRRNQLYKWKEQLADKENNAFPEKRGRAIKPSDIPVDFVDMNGTRLILNTRTSTALKNADVPQSEWYGGNKTGTTAYTKPDGTPVTFDDLASDQLSNNGLPSTGASSLPGGE